MTNFIIIHQIKNIWLYKYIMFQLKVIMKVSLKARSKIVHKFKIIMLRRK